MAKSKFQERYFKLIARYRQIHFYIVSLFEKYLKTWYFFLSRPTDLNCAKVKIVRTWFLLCLLKWCHKYLRFYIKLAPVLALCYQISIFVISVDGSKLANHERGEWWIIVVLQKQPITVVYHYVGGYSSYWGAITSVLCRLKYRINSVLWRDSISTV